MPFYEYRCEKGHTFEVMQRMSDDPLTTCQTCDAKVQRVFHPVAVHFKGSGFYTTDYGSRKKGSGDGGDSGSGSDSSGSSSSESSRSGSGSGDSGSKSESKAGSKSESKTGSSSSSSSN